MKELVYSNGYEEFEVNLLACGIGTKEGQVLINDIENDINGWCSASFVNDGECYE